jgi:hypothetical protein
LTPREQEVLRYVVAGELNKRIAGLLGVGEKTIKVHRARVMQKMQTATLAIWCAPPGEPGFPKRITRNRAIATGDSALAAVLDQSPISSATPYCSNATRAASSTSRTASRTK